ncbi:MAG: methionyl-tRNA formyltransferase, partial [bacterium]|nr:methionyl-tRNA formyltransferase [bacterium]
SEILKFKPDLIILAAYGQILPKEILDIPKYGSINVHPSLLPRWRGPSPIQSAILANDQKTGVSIIKMTEKVDKGPILGQKEIGLTGKETYLDLHNRLGEMGSNLLIEIIQKWIKDEIKPEPQDDSKAVYSKIIKKEDGKIDWEKPAEEIERKIRALNPWPGTYTIQQGKILKILKVEISNGKLIIKEIQPEGKKPMSFEDFLRGYPDFKHPS